MFQCYAFVKVIIALGSVRKNDYFHFRNFFHSLSVPLIFTRVKNECLKTPTYLLSSWNGKNIRCVSLASHKINNVIHDNKYSYWLSGPDTDNF